jgi:hypothetical protein
MKKLYFSALTSTLLAAPSMLAQSAAFVPFNEFMAAARTESASTAMARPAALVKDAQNHEAMRQHILSMYRGVSVSHSYVLDSQHYDCVAVADQPSVRLLGLTSIASAPPATALKTPTGAQPAFRVTDATAPIRVTSQISQAHKFDAFGNATSCEANSIPFRRVTLEEMSRFATLQAFFEKRPAGSVSSISGATPGFVPPDVAGHKYGFTYQYVNNLGGNSNINIWRPYVDTGVGQIFSLSQEWYIAGSGATTQTAEVGWQNYPAKYGSQNSALFIYYTADNYSSTGCYNTDCGAFVQINSSWHFGSGFVNYSVTGGTQYEFSAQYYFYQGNMWLALGGAWVGYYPGSLYQGGQMTQYAQLVEYGGESVGTTTWPGEGSGAWANAGFGQAAYQSNLFYIDTSGAGIWETLTPDTPSTACYSIAGPYINTGNWTRYFYMGGPGC